MIKDITLPDLGEGIDGAEVSEVSVSPGDAVRPEDTILVLESDKASMEIPAEVTGTIKEILVFVGDELKTGQLLMKIEISIAETEAEDPAPAMETETTAPPIREQAKPPAPPVIVPVNIGAADDVFASPGVRRLSRELGINLQIIKGTGPKGRITKNDLHGYIKFQIAMSTGALPAPQSEIDFSQWGEVNVQKLTRIKRIASERLQRAWNTIPHVTQFDEADITDLDALRKDMKTEGAEKDIRVTFLPFFMKATTVVLKEMPEFNSSLDHTNQHLVLKNYYHICVYLHL